MEFQRLLLAVGNALQRDEVKALAFLCTDLLQQNTTSVDSANDLFSRLAEQDCLSSKQPHLLTELLRTIKRTRLIRDLNLTVDESTTISLISPYRKLLYNLSEEITDDDLKHMKFLLNTTLPRRKLEDNVTMLEVFREMEKMDLLSDTNLDELEKIIQLICPMLKEKINEFKALPVIQTASVGQQISRPRSLTYPFELRQDTQPLNPMRTVLGERSEFKSTAQSLLNSSSTSVDVLHGREGDRALSLSALHTETSSCTSLEARGNNFIAGSLMSQENVACPETFQTTITSNEDVGVYPMTSRMRGICLIVNNYDFSKSSLRDREGTKLDEKCLVDVFKWLGFEIKIKRDCTSMEMLSAFQELSRRDHSQMDCVVCCVLSHGEEGAVCGIDGHTVKLMQLMEPLNGLRCPSLAEKPKLFFIQACQGNNEQRAVYIEADGDAQRDSIVANDSIPSDADFLLAMATVPTFVSFREKKNGTWFIQSLCQNLVQMVPRGMDLISILTKVNADVSKKTDITGKKKQMPQPAFSLRKKVVFPVPEAHPPSLLFV